MNQYISTKLNGFQSKKKKNLPLVIILVKERALLLESNYSSSQHWLCFLSWSKQDGLQTISEVYCDEQCLLWHGLSVKHIPHKGLYHGPERVVMICCS